MKTLSLAGSCLLMLVSLQVGASDEKRGVGLLDGAASGLPSSAVGTSPRLEGRRPDGPEDRATGAVPEGLTPGDWTTIRTALEACRHAVKPREDGTLAARNPGQRWGTVFDGRGFLTQSDADGWSWGLTLCGYDFGEEVKQVTVPVAVMHAADSVEYQWNGTLSEWFINDQRGLEQGWTFRTRPLEEAGETKRGDSETELQPLRLELAVCGDLSPRISADGGAVSFYDVGGSTVLTYGGLKAWDAQGRALLVRFEGAGRAILRVAVEEREARYPITIDPIAQRTYLKASNTGAGDLFGSSVAISGDTVVIGASGEQSNATGVDVPLTGGAGTQADDSIYDAGAAYVFVRSDATWHQQAYLKASNTGYRDLFGHSVAVYGDTLVVGAPGERSDATGVNAPLTGGSGTQANNTTDYAGAAYVFVRSGSTWHQQAYLKASNTGWGAQFGSSVAVWGETLVIGSLYEDSNATGVNGTQANNSAAFAGAAYVFVRSDGTWNQQAYLKASNTEARDNFGHSLAMSGETVVVGAPGERSNATGVNALLTGGSGTQADNTTADSGAAYVFVRSGGTWSQQAYLKASNTGMGDSFGFSVAVSDDMAVVGGPGERSNATGVNAPLTGGSGTQADNNSDYAGAAYVFVRSGGTWNQEAYLKASNTGPGDSFGSSVAAWGGTVIVGAHPEGSNAKGVNAPLTGASGTQADNSADYAGAAYVFKRRGGTWGQEAFLKASNTGAYDHFGYSVAVSGDTAIVGAYAESSNATGVNAPLTGGSGTQADKSTGSAGAAYVFTGLGVAPPPAVTAVMPTPIPAVDRKQAFTINGHDFSEGCTVDLRDHRTGEWFRNRPKISQTSTQIELNVNFTSAPAKWSVEVINSDGQCSDPHYFQVGQPLVLGQTVDRLEIRGEPAVAGDTVGRYRAVVVYVDGTASEVTGQAEWSITGSYPPDTDIQAGMLYAGVVDNQTSVVIQASYDVGDPILVSAPYPVAIEPALSVRITTEWVNKEAGIVAAVAQVRGANGSVAYAWDFDMDRLFDDESDQRIGWQFTDGAYGTKEVAVQVTDTRYVRTREHRVSWEKPTTAFDLKTPVPVAIDGLGDRLTASGGAFGFIQGRIPNGVIVLTHGLESSGRKAWIQELALEMSDSVLRRRGTNKLPNILIYDWEDDADPSKWSDTPWWYWDLGDGADLIGPNMQDLEDITAAGIAHGSHLADWMIAQVDAGFINKNAPIHLIGHSAGGFVGGQAAQLLNQRGIYVDRVTMLDTPMPWPDHLRNLPAKGTYIDRVITSYYGSRDHFDSPHAQTDLYSYRYEPSKYVAQHDFMANETGHGYSYVWYHESASMDLDEGFYLSPTMFGEKNINKGALVAMGGLPNQPLAGFQTYGVTQAIDGGFRIVEDLAQDSGIFKTMEIPLGAHSVGFNFHFLGGDTDDRLLVAAKEGTLPFVAPNLPNLRETWLTGALRVAQLGGTSQTIDFRLVGRGLANAAVTITDICFVVDEDIDQDGFTNADELIRGTNSLRVDSDADGVSDYSEVNIHASNPVVADSDGDGASDGAELVAGTALLSAASHFSITRIQNQANGSFLLEWSAVPGKAYRVVRSPELGSIERKVVASGLRAVGTSLSFNDKPPKESARLFYWIEIEPF